MKILLVAPPYRPPNEGTLGIATLRPILEQHGHEVCEIHGAALFPNRNAHERPAVFHWNAKFVFGRALTGWDSAQYVDVLMRSMIAELDPQGVVSPDPKNAWATFGVSEQLIRDDLREKVELAELCIERMVERARESGPFDVIGFSTMFTDQVSAAIVLARRLRELWPGTKIIFGGAVCLEEQGDGLVATFPEVDAACHTEGEQVILPLLEALRTGAPLAGVPGIVWRDDAGGVHHNPSPPLLRDLDTLPIPDYRAFVDQLAASEWGDLEPELFFETSRGCWWGEKSLCTFCGLNGEGLSYRSKTPDRAYREIVGIWEAYPKATYLRAADNILDFKYLTHVFPKLQPLAEVKERPLRMFYEVKSNMKPEQIEQLALGGVREVQPGIESFSNGILKLMRKGCTALGQVQFVKWACQAGLDMSYQVLVLNPGEETSYYHDMLELLPFLEHLPPPQAASTVLLERFSPYHRSPGEFGILNVRPKPFFHDLFGEKADPRLAYKFDFDHPMYEDANHMAVVRQLAARVRNWRDTWKPNTAFYTDEGDRAVIVDARDGTEKRTALLGMKLELWMYLDTNRSRTGIASQFPDVSEELMDMLLLGWLHNRWIARVEDRYVAVLPRKGPRRTGKLKERPERRAGPVRLKMIQPPAAT
ncbi:MAG: RiPP maturation radical SAM C-methyltransferase [Deltaproteobacteria bacterium]|nr:RiPP maturation radical SAM C-methyltransferase [Deltaproteobacteria bacterium]MCW5805388.1 RiPP maturation radical SAM C-methyltransferase [Deltaproteobacteria bacterium]